MSIPIFTIPQYPPNFTPIGSVFVHHVISVKAPTKGVFNYAGAPNTPSNNLEKQVELVRGELLKKLKEDARKKDSSVSALVDVKVNISVFGESSLLGQASATVLIKKPPTQNKNSPMRPNSPIRPNSPMRPNSPVRQNNPMAPLVSQNSPMRPNSPVRQNNPVAPLVSQNSPLGPQGPQGPLGPQGPQGPQGPLGPVAQQGGRKKYVSKLGKSRKNRI